MDNIHMECNDIINVIKPSDLIYIDDNYLLVIQREYMVCDNITLPPRDIKGFNNVLLKSMGSHTKSLLSFLYRSLDWAIQNNIQYIRVEGTLRRYNFLVNIFPDIIKDESIPDRNVFYIKLY